MPAGFMTRHAQLPLRWFRVVNRWALEAGRLSCRRCKIRVLCRARPDNGRGEVIPRLELFASCYKIVRPVVLQRIPAPFPCGAQEGPKHRDASGQHHRGKFAARFLCQQDRTGGDRLLRRGLRSLDCRDRTASALKLRLRRPERSRRVSTHRIFRIRPHDALT